MSQRILVVEDDPISRRYMELLLADEGYETESASDGVEALLALESAAFGAVISDLHMPRMDGIELLVHVRQRWPALPVIVVTADADIECVVEAIGLGAVNYLVKPTLPAAVCNALQRALSVRPTPLPSQDGFPEIVGVSHAIVEVRHRVALAARSDVPVLITGETGTGKELVARAIHRASLTQGPLIAHNCAVAPPELFESQFFGHRRGAFTGADRDHKGLLQQADGGVLFLDELETLALGAQAKLLRVIDDGEVRRVGSEVPERVSTRFFAATNQDPMEMIRNGTLRADLYYRLRGCGITLPPLRERTEDIPLLANAFAAEFGASLGPDAIAALSACQWPGNVRELRNAIRNGASAAAGAIIGARHLPGRDGGRSEHVATLASWGLASGTGTATLRELERNHIVEALRACDGNRTQAALQLGIDRSTLRRKIREFALAPIGSRVAEDDASATGGFSGRSNIPES